MKKTLKQKITSNDVIGLLENLEEDEIKEGIHYSDSGFKGKNKDGFWGTSQSPQIVADYVKEHYSVSMGKHKIKYNPNKDINKHKIELSNKYKSKLKIEFKD